jgi:diguanylate cyclase (GGDEF)-like protein/PAS domain S-box-containing protein
LYLAAPALSLVAYALLVLSTAAAIVTGVVRNRPRRRSPWLLIAAAYVVFSVGTVAAIANQGAFPSWADAIFLGGSLPLLLIGLHRLTRSGAMVLDRASVIDAGILTIGAGFLAWTFLINPFLQNPSLSPIEKAVSVAYPLTDVLMLALLARLGLGAARCLSAALLIASGLALLTADSLYGLARLNSAYLMGGPTDLGWMLFFVFGGVAGLHSSMVQLTEPQVLTHTQMSLRRGVLTVASLLAPTALLLQALRGPVRDGVVIAAVSAVLILLALARMSAVAVSLRQTLARERQLRLACEALLQSSSADEVTGVLRHAVGQLLLDGTDHRVVLALHDDDGSSSDPPDLSTQMELVYVASLPAAENQLAGFDLALRCPLAVGGNRIGDLLVGAAEPALVELHESLPVLAGQAATMIDRIRLNREISRRDSQAYFRTLVLNASEVIAIVADDNRISYVSPAALPVFGSADLIGTSILDLIEPDMCDEVSDALAAVRAGRPVETLGLWPVRRTDGTLVHAEVAIGDMRHEEGVNGLVLTLRDVTARIGLEQELIARAYIDPLTGLGNRLRFQDDVAAAAAAASPDRLGAVLVVNVDDFRAVNDTMGHEAGDQLLVALGERLSTLAAGRATVCRLGADEFGLVAADAGDAEAVESFAEQIVASSAEGLPVGGAVVTARLRIGVATTLDAGSAHQLLGQADVALDAAHSSAGSGWRRYEATLHAEVLDQMQLRADLACAVTDSAFRLHYQPIVELGSGRTVGFEALLRWPHPTRGMVSPVTFIPLAEDSGLIVELGRWVLRTAIRQAAQWARLNPDHAPYVSVNVSVRQLRMPDFVSQVLDELAAGGLPAHQLTLEITESLLLGEHGQIPAEVARLRKHGIKVSIDDFGTGYSSLSYLHQVPVDVLKLDKSFVDTMTTSDRQHALVRGILQLAATLSLPVVAEGIETEAEHRLLAEAGCAYGQGFLFARPLTEQDAQLRIEQEAAPVG